MNCTDDNIFCENQGNPHMSDPGCVPDLHRTHCCMWYPGTGNLKFPAAAHHLQTKKLPSPHYIQHHWWWPVHLRSQAHNASLPVWKSPDVYRYLDEIRHPCKHSSGSENLCHCSLPQDRSFSQDTWSHLKMYSKIPWPAPQKDLWPGIYQTRTILCVLWYVVRL